MEDLFTQAKKIKNETAKKQNTAQRIGGWMVDLLHSLKEYQKKIPEGTQNTLVETISSSSPAQVIANWSDTSGRFDFNFKIPSGQPGGNGISVFTTFNVSEAKPAKPQGNGTASGWNRNQTSDSVWMSTKNSLDVNNGEWGDPIKIKPTFLLDRGQGLIVDTSGEQTAMDVCSTSYEISCDSTVRLDSSGKLKVTTIDIECFFTRSGASRMRATAVAGFILKAFYEVKNEGNLIESNTEVGPLAEENVTLLMSNNWNIDKRPFVRLQLLQKDKVLFEKNITVVRDGVIGPPGNRYKPVITPILGGGNMLGFELVSDQTVSSISSVAITPHINPAGQWMIGTTNTGVLADTKPALDMAAKAASTANSAKSAADLADSNASLAVSKANTAISAADSAVSNASLAASTANSAKSAADFAVSNASLAVSEANTAIRTANSAKILSINYKVINTGLCSSVAFEADYGTVLINCSSSSLYSASFCTLPTDEGKIKYILVGRYDNLSNDVIISIPSSFGGYNVISPGASFVLPAGGYNTPTPVYVEMSFVLVTVYSGAQAIIVNWTKKLTK